LKSDEFIREVDEELRRDRLLSLWQRYGRTLIALVVLLVVGVAAWEGWKAWRGRQMAAAAEALLAIERDMAAGRWAEAASAFAATAEGGEPGPATIARLREAAALARAGDADAVAAALGALADRADADPLLRQLATLLLAQHALDSADPAELRSRLVPLAEAGQPWRNAARELLALLALRAGDMAQARTLLDSIVDDVDSPPGLRQRAAALRDNLQAAP
jgi:hypothetical protein